ncbi:uncharacterized protein si:dkeyp-117h8.4 isoform X2 [Gadus chalcogrammus]|uniref:uncharacterized protein si:dkeyp-117h8.4 isoform X2 n=1 Tax=Gadus chalcogrammus TaxID=1042646 RepID=UPI0024C4C850|nr:uncharacterized protein si:dkeyp-117h8.4 isoform X2 [Gadus chalcogrammus]
MFSEHADIFMPARLMSETAEYNKLSKRVGAKVVDFKHETNGDIARSITATELEISRIEAERPTSWREYSFTEGNTTNDSQIDYQVKQSNESVESNDSIIDGVSEMDQTQASGIGLLDEPQGNLMDVLVQPEDQDEELEQTLSSPRSTLMELFPQMITQMGKTSPRQRYTKMRPIGSKAGTGKPSPRGDCHDLCQSGDEHNLKAAVKSCVAMIHSPVQRHSNLTQPLQLWGASSESEADRVRRDGQWTEFSLLMQSKESMNHTFTVSKGSHPCTPLSGKPQGQSHSTAVQSPAQTLRFNRSNGPYVMESSTVPKTLQSLLNTRGRNHNGYGGSPKALARQNPVSSSIHEQHSRSPKRRLYHQDCHSPSRIRSDSLQSSLRPGGMYSPAKIEEAFRNLYHKVVCLAKAPLSKCSPCRCSARRLEANIGSSSSPASAPSPLALSPHRSNLRKRARELD